MAHIVQAITVPWYNACADYAVVLARSLKMTGHRVTVAGGEGTPSMERARAMELDVLDHLTPAAHNPLTLNSLANFYRAYALDNGVDVVNAHHGRDHLIWAYALRGTGIPLVRTSGNQIPPKAHPAAKYLIRRHTAGVIASCRTIRNFYADGFGMNPERIPVINGGVDSDFFTVAHPRNTLRDSLGLPPDGFVFGIIGRFSPVKGHRYFFEAARLLLQKFPDVWFVASGWDAQLNLANMKEMAESAGIIERIRFTGRQHDIRDLIASVDAGVIASVGSETVCRIAMEYMAMGVPVVASDTNVIPEVIRDNYTGFIAPKANPEAMAICMERLLSSREQAATLGGNGRETVEREYSLTRFAEKTLEAYRKMSIHV